ncbi:hypothetical protein EJ05DRAFT_508282 [Pseudovirgaria hyperparasitica]|uniref:Cytochrome oxidase c assembly domain-containing protein n=1 Tax=Pseudovirgaria hyperparasitica TaxID=470096 RepID=A0A6A6WHE0_9PEZI|nr:uncharacterized protein EJ05DRAFT_508282 [Pseudovirgaria hyperparasitica]KAF2761067.1 hypothetical protein EJ05DRAFT_508282 [Pseudovirgaria hyperparasitica]
MARTVEDATRFTQTNPYAAKPGRTSTISISDAPPGETPQQKLRRLREAARIAKLGEVSQWDRIVQRGRVWADRSHRVFSFTLIGFTGLIFVYCAASTIDMLAYNRRKRNAFYEQQKIEMIEYIRLARDAESNGTATPLQLELLGLEREKEQKRQDKEKNAISNKIKSALFGSLSTEESVGGKLGEALMRTSAPDTSLGGTTQETGEGLGIVKALEENTRRASQTRSTKTGGQLDQLGENVANAASDTTKSWVNWLTRR